MATRSASGPEEEQRSSRGEKHRAPFRGGGFSMTFFLQLAVAAAPIFLRGLVA